MIEANSSPKPQIINEIERGKLNYLPTNIVEGIEERQGILYEFAKDPSNPEIWNLVATKARQEEEAGSEQPEELIDISADSLIELARAVLQAAPEDRYALVATEAPNGETWFDALYGFHSQSGDTAIEAAIKKQLEDLQIDKVEIAVDLGTGTGKTAVIVAEHAQSTVGVDRNASLIAVAKEKHPDIHFIQGSVTRLPFEDGSVDIITSDGLKYALDEETSVRMYSEIARVLKEGGVYIDTDWEETKHFGADFHPEELKQFVTWRAVLQDMIVDTVSGKFEKKDSLEMRWSHKWDDLSAQLGLDQLMYRYNSNKAHARMLYKNPTTALADHRRHLAYIRGVNNR